MVTFHASAALIERFEGQATHAHCRSRCDVAAVKPLVS